MLAISTCGCATVINGRNAEVALRSEPSGADVTVRASEGSVVAKTVTPGSVSLKRGRSWGRPASHVATFEKAGYLPSRVPIESTWNPWVLGNVLIGGGLGAGVDVVTGAQWRPKHSEIGGTLVAATRDQWSPGTQSPDPSSPIVQPIPIATDESGRDDAVTPAAYAD
ncbi:MAG: hypothetical protein AAF805_03915 [Planctomycetota bacterium]